MKKNTILILLPVFALQGCLKEYVSEAPAIPDTREMILMFIAKKSKGEDMTLYLYTNPITRKLVVAFFTEIT